MNNPLCTIYDISEMISYKLSRGKVWFLREIKIVYIQWNSVGGVFCYYNLYFILVTAVNFTVFSSLPIRLFYSEFGLN